MPVCFFFVISFAFGFWGLGRTYSNCPLQELEESEELEELGELGQLLGFDELFEEIEELDGRNEAEDAVSTTA